MRREVMVLAICFSNVLVKPTLLSKSRRLKDQFGYQLYHPPVQHKTTLPSGAYRFEFIVTAHRLSCSSSCKTTRRYQRHQRNRYEHQPGITGMKAHHFQVPYDGIKVDTMNALHGY